MLFRLFIRKSCDKIHVDQIKAHLTRLIVYPDRIFSSVLSSQPYKRPGSHGLGIYAYSGNPVISHRFELACRDRVRPAGFDRNFRISRYLQIRIDGVQERSELSFFQNRRRAASDIKRSNRSVDLF